MSARQLIFAVAILAAASFAAAEGEQQFAEMETSNSNPAQFCKTAASAPPNLWSPGCQEGQRRPLPDLVPGQVG